MTPAILVNYNFTPDWLLDYPELNPIIISDRSDDGVERNLERFGKVIKSPNVGDVDYDKLSYIVEQYDNLPDYFLWSKTNLFKFITPEEYDKVKDNKTFTPLLTMNHKTYSDRAGVVCKYEAGIYWERNDSWYVSVLPHNYATYYDFAKDFNLPSPAFLPFAPGGSYILSRDVVHRYSRDYYEKLMSILPYCRTPAEAHMLERTYYTLWR